MADLQVSVVTLLMPVVVVASAVGLAAVLCLALVDAFLDLF